MNQSEFIPASSYPPCPNEGYLAPPYSTYPWGTECHSWVPHHSPAGYNNLHIPWVPTIHSNEILHDSSYAGVAFPTPQNAASRVDGPSWAPSNTNFNVAESDKTRHDSSDWNKVKAQQSSTGILQGQELSVAQLPQTSDAYLNTRESGAHTGSPKPSITSYGSTTSTVNNIGNTYRITSYAYKPPSAWSETTLSLRDSPRDGSEKSDQ